ncbi:MAG: nucleotidyltransferase domain-containing protein, partial [Chloroflexota bacterium]
MTAINLGILAQSSHEDLIRDMANKCVSDERIQAIWVGGSLASGTGDAFSDIDFRIAVKPGQVSAWVNPEWDHYLPILPCGGTVMQFGDQALLHHLVLRDGTIVDFFVQDTERQNFEPHLVIIACRDDALKKKLEGFARPVASLVKEVDGETLERFFVDYWITTHKEVK